MKESHTLAFPELDSPITYVKNLGVKEGEGVDSNGMY